jgi:hypothetical protein
MPERGCELCAAERLTRWYHEDDVCWVADCEVCDVPMVVWRIHGTAPSDGEIAHMTARLAEATRIRFGTFAVDLFRRNIPDHWHAHGRPQGAEALRWWMRRWRS